ncbi:MAG: hypothetical protein RL328_1390 [Acidobacteriota bacterium]|jgi:hypothetical protein
MAGRKKPETGTARLQGPLESVRLMVTVSLEAPGRITAEDIQAEIDRLKEEHRMLTHLIRSMEKLAVLRYEAVGPVSKRGPKVK